MQHAAGMTPICAPGSRPARSDQAAELARWRRLFLASAALTAPVFLVAMVLPAFPALRPALGARAFWGFSLGELVKWACATPVQFYIGWRFHAGAWAALRNSRCAAAAGRACTARSANVNAWTVLTPHSTWHSPSQEPAHSVAL